MAEDSAHIFKDVAAKRKAQAEPDDCKKLKAPLPAGAAREDAPDAEAVTAKEAEGGLEKVEEEEEEEKKGVENCDESEASDEESDGPYGESEEESDEDEDEDEGDGSLESEGDSSDVSEGEKAEEESSKHLETSSKGKAPVSEGEAVASKGLGYNGKGKEDTKGKAIVEDKGKGKRVEDDDSDKQPSDDDDGGDLSDDPLDEVDPGNILSSRFRRRNFQPLHFNAGKVSGKDDNNDSDA